MEFFVDGMWKTEGTVNGGKEGGESRSGARGKEGKIIPRYFLRKRIKYAIIEV